MRPPWLRSPSRVHTTSTPSKNFYCSSLKDVQSLFKEDHNEEAQQFHRPKKLSIFHRVRISTAVLRNWSTPTRHDRDPETVLDTPIVLPNSNNRIVLFFTSLRVVRKTFEDCRAVRSILRGFRVSIDERDLSMDASFLDELQGILGPKNTTLPRVFIGGRYVGGADEIRRLNETGELKKLIQRLPFSEFGVCDTCGGHRFVLCEYCSGSHKVFVEKSGFRSCSACNENGLIRCPSCVPVLL